MDGGRALCRTLQVGGLGDVNAIGDSGIGNLSITSVRPPTNLATRKEAGSYQQYAAQFPEDYGLVLFNAMLGEFFGACTDIA